MMNVGDGSASIPAGIHAARDHEGMSRAAAGLIIDCIRAKPDSLLCLATGSSPERAYGILAEEARRDPALFSRARIIKLDEWGGLGMDDPATCEEYIREKGLEPLGIGRDRYLGWESRPRDPAGECARVAAWLASDGPIDIGIFGLGLNGHLGLNEPGEELQAGPHVAELTPESLAHSMLRRARKPVLYGLTLGMADILRSRRILLLVSGARKAECLRRALAGGITPRFPASFLRLHPDLRVFCDRDAAAELPKGFLPREAAP